MVLPLLSGDFCADRDHAQVHTNAPAVAAAPATASCCLSITAVYQAHSAMLAAKQYSTGKSALALVQGSVQGYALHCTSVTLLTSAVITSLT